MLGTQGKDAADSCVNMKPNTVQSTEICQLKQRINRTANRGSCCGHHRQTWTLETTQVIQLLLNRSNTESSSVVRRQ